MNNKEYIEALPKSLKDALVDVIKTNDKRAPANYETMEVLTFYNIFGYQEEMADIIRSDKAYYLNYKDFENDLFSDYIIEMYDRDDEDNYKETIGNMFYKMYIEDGQPAGMFVELLARVIVPKDVVKYQFKQPEQKQYNLLNVSDQIFQGIQEGEWKLTSKGKFKNKKIGFFVSVSADNETILNINNLNAFDMIIFDTICTFYKNGILCFTSKMILRFLRGNKAEDNRSHSYSLLEDIEESIEKLRMTWLETDFSDMYRMKKLLEDKEASSKNKKVKGLYGRNPLVELKARYYFELNGSMTMGYLILAAPDLYEKAEMTKQTTSVSMDIYKMADGINCTRHTIILKDYLIKRIEWMKHDNSIKQKSILYDKIYDKCEIDGKTEKSRFRTTISKMMENLKKTGYIQDYHINEDGKIKYYSIEIEL